jgi:(E)-4-hydroxy-3-methylbut-2-enyl-diphosphate synthase
MKSSNVKVMVQANRLLVKRMLELGMDYPIHLGVTEAGDGEDGRIKSAAGIGPLLADGIGDTIRVSLTEDPEFEIPVARSIVEAVKMDAGSGKLLLSGSYGFDPFSYTRRNKKSWTPSAAPLVVAGPLPKGDQSPPFKTEFVPDLVAGHDERLLTGFATPADQTNAFVPVIIRTGEDLASLIPHLSPRDALVFNPEERMNVTVTR